MDILSELPLGFSMALAKKNNALQAFSNLSDDEKRAVINGTHNVQTKREMQEYVDELTKSAKL